MTYTTITQQHIDALREICAPERVYCGEAISQDLAHDELAGIHRLPEVVVEPVSSAEVAALLRYAHAQNIPVTPRGQGTGLVGGAVPLFGGILLHLVRMNRILELDAENMTLTVEPGVLLLDIYEYVESRGFYYAPNPGEKSATIGGNVSTNAGGMSAVKYGVTRDAVRGLEVVLADGTLLEVGGKVVEKQLGLQPERPDRRLGRHPRGGHQSDIASSPAPQPDDQPAGAVSGSGRRHARRAGAHAIKGDSPLAGIHGTRRDPGGGGLSGQTISR